MSEAIVGASLWIGTVLFSRLLVAGNSVPSSIPLVSTKANSKHVYHTLVVTRIHGISSLDKAMEGMLRDFVLRSRKYASMVLICIGAPTLEDSMLYNKKYRDYLEALDLNDGSVEVLPIFPWGSFTTALNIGLRRALDLQCYTRVIFQSLEYSVDDRVMPCIQNYMDADQSVLVAGPAMVGHNFLVGRQCLRGRTSPWNTCAVWCLRKLAILGFPSIGDGVWQDPSTGGVEEVSTIAILQRLNPILKAVLLRFSSEASEWDVSFSDRKRLEWHARKMASKDQRPQRQLEDLGLSGVVDHIVVQG